MEREEEEEIFNSINWLMTISSFYDVINAKCVFGGKSDPGVEWLMYVDVVVDVDEADRPPGLRSLGWLKWTYSSSVEPKSQPQKPNPPTPIQLKKTRDEQLNTWL